MIWIVLMIAAFIFTMWAQINVKTTFSKYSNGTNASGITAAEAARMILDGNGLNNIRIEHISGELTDHYDPKADVIRLSDSVYGSTSAAAIGVAAHEAGHAVQHYVGYAPIKLRTALVPVCNIGSNLAWPLILLGLFFSIFDLAVLGVILFSAATVFQFVTLPCEFDASARAMQILTDSGRFSSDDLAASRKTLNAAALTYVAALAVSLINLLRVISMVRGSRRR